MYERGKKIGEGTYSNVYTARNSQTGQLVALKEIFLNKEEGAPCTALREIAFLKQLHSQPHIIKLLQVLHPREDSLTLVFEHLSLDLKQFIEKHFPTGMPSILIKHVGRQILMGLHTCHVNHILHRDLKPQNILLDLPPDFNPQLTTIIRNNNNNANALSGLKVKIGDFGLARGFAIPVSGYCAEVVTLWYRPPEILMGCTHYGPAVDLWSFACILVEMLTGVAIFRGKNCDDQIRRIVRILGRPNERDLLFLKRCKSNPQDDREKMNILNEGYLMDISSWGLPSRSWEAVLPPYTDPLLIDLLGKLFLWAPDERLSALQALAHPFFQQ